MTFPCSGESGIDTLGCKVGIGGVVHLRCVDGGGLGVGGATLGCLEVGDALLQGAGVEGG